jgi:hypothetical protein
LASVDVLSRNSTEPGTGAMMTDARYPASSTARRVATAAATAVRTAGDAHARTAAA